MKEKLRKLGQKIRLLRSHPSDYPGLLWVIYVFFGGAINAVAMKNFVEWYQEADQYAKIHYNKDILSVPEALPYVFSFALVVFIIPIILSMLFSKHHPEKKLVPPLYMQFVSLGFLAALVYNSVSSFFSTYYFVAVSAGAMGIVQDVLLIAAFGRTVNKDNILRHSLKISANVEKARPLITTQQFLRLRNLRIVDREKGKSLVLKTQSRVWQRVFGFQLLIEISEGDRPGESILNMVSYHMESYGPKHIDKGDDSYEHAENTIAILKSFFERNGIVATDDSAENAESLANYAMDEMQGIISHMRKMPARKVIIILASGISLLLGFGLLIFDKTDLSVSVLALAAFLILDGVFRE